MAAKTRRRNRKTLTTPAPTTPAPLPQRERLKEVRRARPESSRRLRDTAAAVNTRQRTLILAALVAVVFLVFVRVVGQDFVLWDDTIEVYKNPYFDPVTGDHLSYLWQHAYLNLYIPLSSTAFALLAMIAHLDVTNPAITSTGALLDPHVFHTFNLAIHLVNVLLVFAIVRMLVRNDLAAGLGALLFGIHPVQVESVAWVSELRGLLCGCFSLLSIYLYLKFAQATKAGRRGANAAPAYFGAAMLAAVLALLAKPSAVSLPLILFALDCWCIGRPWRQCALSAAPLLAGSLIFILVTSSAQPVEARLITPLWQRPFVAGDALAFYLAKLVAPINLAIDYGRTPGQVLNHWWGYVTWLAPAAVAAAIWLRRTSAPWALACGAVSVAAVLPVLGLLPFGFQHYSTVADRYLYLALLGPALAVAYLFALAQRTLRTQTLRALLGAVGVVALALGTLSVLQAGYWDDSRTLLTHAISVNGNSDVSYGNRGIYLAQHGRMADALVDLHRAIAINPDNYQAHSNLGNVLLLQKHVDAAIVEYRTSIRIKSDWDESHTNLGAALATKGDLSGAVAQFQEGLRLNPFSKTAQAGLQHAQALLNRGKPAGS